MEGGWAAVEDLLDEGGEGRAGSPVLREGGDLLLSGDLAGEEEPEETLGQRLRPTGGLGEGLLALGDGLATEANALLCVGVGVSYRSDAGKRAGCHVPASRTEPSQMRAGRPRMPLRGGFREVNRGW